MDTERNKEIQNEIKNSTFELYEGEVKVKAESGPEAPEFSVEEKGVEKVDVKEESKKEAKKPSSSSVKGLGFEIDDFDENISEVIDYSSTHIWREALKKKKKVA